MGRERLLVIGAGGHGTVVADCAAAVGWQAIVFFDDKWPDLASCGDRPVLGRCAALLDHAAEDAAAFVAIGDATRRLEWLERLQSAGLHVPTLVHPGSHVSPRAGLGLGSLVVAGAVINAGAVIGRGCIVNSGATIDHDCHVADGVHICPGANVAGNVRIGRGSWIGIGSCVIQGVHVGNGATVGAGAAVISDVPDDVKVVGVPARRLQVAGEGVHDDA